MTGNEYIYRFGKFILWCDIQEDSFLILSRFHIGLISDLQRKMLPHIVDSVKEANQISFLGFKMYSQMLCIEKFCLLSWRAPYTTI